MSLLDDVKEISYAVLDSVDTICWLELGLADIYPR